MDTMLADIVGSVDEAILLKSFQQLASQFPNEVLQIRCRDTRQR
jgi:hypothetical protein